MRPSRMPPLVSLCTPGIRLTPVTCRNVGGYQASPTYGVLCTPSGAILERVPSSMFQFDGRCSVLVVLEANFDLGGIVRVSEDVPAENESRRRFPCYDPSPVNLVAGGI